MGRIADALRRLNDWLSPPSYRKLRPVDLPPEAPPVYEAAEPPLAPAAPPASSVADTIAALQVEADACAAGVKRLEERCSTESARMQEDAGKRPALRAEPVSLTIEPKPGEQSVKVEVRRGPGARPPEAPRVTVESGVTTPSPISAPSPTLTSNASNNHPSAAPRATARPKRRRPAPPPIQPKPRPIAEIIAEEEARMMKGLPPVADAPADVARPVAEHGTAVPKPSKRKSRRKGRTRP